MPSTFGASGMTAQADKAMVVAVRLARVWMRLIALLSIEYAFALLNIDECRMRHYGSRR